MLHHAGTEAVHGADLMRELARHGHDIGPGTLYPMLHRLERDGLVRSESRVVEGRRRKEYRLTARGSEELEAATVLLRELADELLHDRGPESIGSDVEAGGAR